MSTTESGAAARDRSGRLAGKVALITGAGGNFGETIVRRYLEEGARVVMVGRNRGKLEATLIKASGGHFDYAGTRRELASRDELTISGIYVADGPVYLVMRLYWPKTGAPSILPPGKGTWAPPGIVKVP
jgi:hypothetical protein